jgi:hypothetical protein
MRLVLWSFEYDSLLLFVVLRYPSAGSQLLQQVRCSREGRAQASHKLLSFGPSGREVFNVRPYWRNVQFRASAFNGKVPASRSAGNRT